MKDWISILIFIACAFSAKADIPPARANHGCVLLQSTIYCYGGCQRGTPRVALQNGLFYSLDVSKEKSVNELHSSWVLNNAGNIGANYYLAMVALPELNSFLIDGGTREIDSIPQAYTFIYNATGQGTWNTSIPPGGHLHVDSHTAVTGDNSRVYIAGGRTLAVYQVTGAAQYPTQMVIFDPPSTFGSSTSTLPSFTSKTRLHHKGAFINDGKTIWFVGGIYPAPPPSESSNQILYGHADMYEILTYDTASGIWATKVAGGMHPAPRMDHSLTLKPSTNELIVYGGTEIGSDEPIGDYFYILDVDNLIWSNQSLGSSNGALSAGPRFGHVAVLVGDSSLFIIFGSNGAATSDLSVLNIDNWSWMTTVPAYTAANNTTSIQHDHPSSDDPSSDDPSSDDSSSDNTGLSIGAIVGIVVGSVAFLAIIGALILFFILRKRHIKSNDERDSDMPVLSPPHEKSTGQRTSNDNTNSSEPRIPHPWSTVTTEVRKPEYEAPSRDAPASQPLLAGRQARKPDGGGTEDSPINKRIVLVAMKPDKGQS